MGKKNAKQLNNINKNMANLDKAVSWCSWLSRQSNTLKVSGSSPGDAILVFLN